MPVCSCLLCVPVIGCGWPAQDFPVAVFGDLYHQRRRIEEAFKRLTPPAARMCLGADAAGAAGGCGGQGADVQPGSTGVYGGANEPSTAVRVRVCNRAYAAVVMQRWLPGALVVTQGLQGLQAWIANAIALLGKNLVRRVAARSQPRPVRHVKSHPHMAYKG